jgi:putative HSP protein
MNPNKLGNVAPGGGAEKTSNFTAEQNPVKNFEAEKNSEKPKTGAEIFEMKMHQIADRRDMIEQMKMEGKLGFDDYKTKKQALDLVETKLTKLYNIYENRETNEAEREKELEIQNRHFEESKDSLRNLSQDKELPRDEKMKLMESFSQRLVESSDKIEEIKKAREMDERVYQLFGGKSGEEKPKTETKEKTEGQAEKKTEKETEEKTEDTVEGKTEDKSEENTEEKIENKTESQTEEKTEGKSEESSEKSEAPDKKPTSTFSWTGGVGGPMFYSGASAPMVKVNKTVENSTTGNGTSENSKAENSTAGNTTTENSTAGGKSGEGSASGSAESAGAKTEALNVTQKEVLKQAEDKFFQENLKTLGGAMAANGYKEMDNRNFLMPLKKPEAGSPDLASFDERNKLHNESIEKMKAFEKKFDLDKIKLDVGRAVYTGNVAKEFGIGLYRIDASRNELQKIIDDKRSSEEEKQKAMKELEMLDQVKEGFLENIGSHVGEKYSNEEIASVPENERKNANRYLFLKKVKGEMRNPYNIALTHARMALSKASKIIKK